MSCVLGLRGRVAFGVERALHQTNPYKKKGAGRTKTPRPCKEMNSMAERDSGKRRRNNDLRPLEVVVENNNVGRALSQLKREMARDGIRKELKRRRFYEKPSVKKRRKWREAERRRRKERRRARMARA